MNGQNESTLVEFKTNSQTANRRDSAGRNIPVFYTELKRRHVLKTAAAYIVVAWVVAQVADVLCDGFVAPDWVMRAVLISLALGLPIAIVISWYFEFSASLEWDPDTEPIGAIVRQKGRKIDFVIISVLTLVVGMLLVWRPEATVAREKLCTPEPSYSQSIVDKAQNDRAPIPN